MEKKELIRYAKAAKSKGNISRYNMAKEEIKKTLIYQKRIQDILSEIKKMESMSNSTSTRRDIIHTLDAFEEEIKDIFSGTNSGKYQYDSRKEIFQGDTLLQRLAYLLDALETPYENNNEEKKNDEEMNKIIEHLIEMDEEDDIKY